MALFYDNNYSVSDASGYLEVERVFALRFSEFHETDWAKLSQIYESLPSWQGQGEHGCPCWFSKSEEAPFLFASVEPSGLQVIGVLGEAEWTKWSDKFVSKLDTLPTFEV